MVNVIKGGGRAPPPSSAWANFTFMMECTPGSSVCYSVYSVDVPVGLPPVRVVLVDDMEDVPALEGDAQLVAGDVEVVIRHVGEVCAVVVHGLALLLLYFVLHTSKNR